MSYADGSFASNTTECWRRLVGERIAGAFSTFSDGCTHIWLVTESRAAFVFTSNGSFWRASAEEVERETSKIKQVLDAQIAALGDVLRVAGA